MQHARDRIRELTERRRLLVPVEEVVQDLNRFLRGWAGYFRHGNSARHFHLVSTYANDRLALFVAKRHQRARAYGWRAVVYRSPDRFGLINLNGSVVAPRPNRPWREKPNAGGEERRRAVCGRTACTVRSGGGRNPVPMASAPHGYWRLPPTLPRPGRSNGALGPRSIRQRARVTESVARACELYAPAFPV